MVTTIEAPVRTFSEWVACDSGCGARSLWKISGVADLPVYLCGHHKEKNEKTPKMKAWATDFVQLDPRLVRS